MKITKIERYQLCLPLITPFQTSYGVLEAKPLDLLILEDELGNRGYGELVSFEQPDYIEETIGADRQLIEEQLVPRLFQSDLQKAGDVWSLFQTIQGNFMAKSALETAVWDLFAKREQRSLQSYFGSHKSTLPVGVSVGIHATTEELIAQVSSYLKQGYQRIKVKIKPGYDIVPLSAIRENFPDVTLMADANSAYTLADLELFKQLDQLNLAMIEQPFHQRDFVDHARLQQQLQTKICLDENIRTVEDVKTAYALGSCRSINLKIPRVGGITEALRIVDFCQTHQLLVWLGGMFESGIGRALNLQFASQTSFTFPGDISAANRYYAKDIIKEPAKMEKGRIAVPQGVGLGIEIDWRAIEEVCEQKQTFSFHYSIKQ
ncbi:o-succinylbenzoate synthase [Enterococcus sp. DIV0660C]|uniref:o-succinylbenzoate synthase n=1 Tax=Enterococcus sp. DIV0660C TaxID=2230880 RepID=UPI001A8C48B9|nr:o-succinylbenzoate synthase [Enterococcus sp. DIV0660C]MBO0431221.1 o-succinylbenzoate synthase [Enterococcus sp. DIV0660C]